ncbi:MAG TPA: D-glycerate dehydrogenase [Dehalococcoidia bacterium]|nr:D-glycerate dehydrogenase [Dehalococcoidia bacterium]
MNPGRPRVFVTRKLVGDGVERLARELDVEVWPEPDPPPRDVLIAEAAKSQGLLTTLTDRIDAELLDAAPGLRMVANLAVGYDNIDVGAATARRVLITNTPGVLTETVADLTFALILSFARRMPEGDRAVRDGTWGVWSPHFLLGRDVHGTTIGIVGLGAIGLAVARRALGFGMKVIYYNRTRKAQAESELGLEYASLEELLRRSDWVSVSIALNEETRNLLGSAEFRMMKPDGVIVNTARGGVIDQAALVEALRERRIGGAALDVFAVEPIPTDDPLLALDNVIVMPHLGSASVQTRTAMTDLCVDNLLAVFRGDGPLTPVNPEVLA